MKLEFKNVIDKENGKNAIVIGLGPSLTPHISKIKELKLDGYVLIGCNHIDEYTDIDIDYWCFANTSFPMNKMYERVNRKNSTVIYADSADPSPREDVDKLLTTDYLPFDQRHFNSKPEGPEAWIGIPGIKFNECCKHIIPGRLIIQEELKKYTKYHQHCPNVYTVSINMIILAVLLGCKNIYVAGVDLDYSNGYVNGYPSNSNLPEGHNRVMTDLDVELMLDSIKVVRDSAKNINTNIYCIDKDLHISSVLEYSVL